MPDGDTLCEYCAPIPLFSLFTGSRGYLDIEEKCEVSAELGTFQHVCASSKCPLCRLVKHIIDRDGLRDELCTICDASEIQCILCPFRMDYGDEMKFLNLKTKDMLATRLVVRFVGLPITSAEAQQDLRRYQAPIGIQLLSPGSIDPSRPLLNGFAATTTDQSLRLLSIWLEGCDAHHHETCQLSFAAPQVGFSLQRIRAIDVHSRSLVEVDAEAARYAALSYVWGANSAAYARLATELDVELDEAGIKPVRLPSSVPKIIEDAMHVCRVTSIPYLWCDLYCIHQTDPASKAAEIDAMGHIYRSSYVTLVAGGPNRELILTPPIDAAPGAERQRTETIGDRTYITENARVYDQLWSSEWILRSWTYQEGHLARRVAFFGGYDVSFMCGAGHWRESIHSGIYGHDATIPGVDLSSNGFNVLSGHQWLRTPAWDFEDYTGMVLNYTRRQLTYESDKLAALTGCLKLLEERKGVAFVSGLPTADFHYALLWAGEDGLRREGFPSWSWAGWVTSMNVFHLVGPIHKISARLDSDDDGGLSYRQHENDSVVELQGLLVRSTMNVNHRWNRCTQRLASIRMRSPFHAITIESEAARFFIEILPENDECEDELCRSLQANSVTGLEPTKHYDMSKSCVCIRDRSGNTYRYSFAWLSNWPLLSVRLPGAVCGSDLAWLMHDGLDLIKIVDVELLEGDSRIKPFRHVLCLGIDRSEGIPGRGRRMGTFCIPGEYWERAGPGKMTVELW